VRLEQNYIDPNVFSSILDAKFGDSAGICCDARSKWSWSQTVLGCDVGCVGWDAKNWGHGVENWVYILQMASSG